MFTVDKNRIFSPFRKAVKRGILEIDNTLPRRNLEEYYTHKKNMIVAKLPSNRGVSRSIRRFLGSLFMLFGSIGVGVISILLLESLGEKLNFPPWLLLCWPIFIILGVTIVCVISCVIAGEDMINTEELEYEIRRLNAARAEIIRFFRRLEQQKRVSGYNLGQLENMMKREYVEGTPLFSYEERKKIIKEFERLKDILQNRVIIKSNPADIIF